MELKRLKIAWIFSIIILVMVCFQGCRKKTEPAPPEKPKAEQVAAEKIFLASENVTVCKLEKIKVSKLDLPENANPSFVRRMEHDGRNKLKQGTITLDDREYLVLLGDTHGHEFYIYDIEKKNAPYWWGSWSLHSTHLLNGKYYEFMLTDGGDKLAGRPYTGEFGTFKLGKGNRQLEKIEMSGSVKQAGDRSAPIGNLSDNWPKPVAECSIPVGDYTPYIMSITYDNLRISISHNYYNNAQGQRSMDNIIYGMPVRKDQPYVLDFSNKPTIIFEKPKKENTSFSLGEEVKISAVLVDPKLDIMIRGLDDTSVKVGKERMDKDGNMVDKYEVDKSLDPTVVISRSDGEVVAEGIMPFG